MKITIYGAGAVGCTIGAQLYGCDNAEVTLVARGEHYRVMQENSLQFINRDGERNLRLACTDDPSALPPQDCVIISVKAYSIAEIAPAINRLFHDDTVVIPICNGVPWWFLLGDDLLLKNRRLDSLDPDGIIERNIPLERVIGGLLYTTATLVKPGVVSNFEGPKFIIGEPSGGISDRLQEIGNVLESAGFIRPVTEDMRAAIWKKLCWNIAFNTLAVITGKTSGEMTADKEIRSLAVSIMQEMEGLAEILGINMQLDIEKHVQIAQVAGSFKPSMLQDYERGKPMEIDAIIGSVCEIAEKLRTTSSTDITTPHITEVYDNLLKVINHPHPKSGIV